MKKYNFKFRFIFFVIFAVAFFLISKLEALAAAPQLYITPSSGNKGALFSYVGVGFTPNRVIIETIIKPDGTSYPQNYYTANSIGAYTHTYDSSNSSMAGTFTISWQDDATKQKTTAYQTVVAVPAIITPAPAPTVFPKPTVSIIANPLSAPYNSSVFVSWVSTNASGCTVSPNGWTGTNGYQNETLTASKTYTLNCSGQGGSASDKSIVAVKQPISQQGESDNLTKEINSLLAEMLRYIQYNDESEEIQKLKEYQFLEYIGDVSVGNIPLASSQYKSAKELFNKIKINREIILQDLANAKSALKENDIQKAHTQFTTAKQLYANLTKQEEIAQEVFLSSIETGEQVLSAAEFFVINACDLGLGACSIMTNITKFLVKSAANEVQDKALNEFYTDIIIKVLFSKVPIKALNDRTLSEAVSLGIVKSIDSQKASAILGQLINSPNFDDEVKNLFVKYGVPAGKNASEAIFKKIIIGMKDLFIHEAYVSTELETINSDAAHITTAPASEVASAVNEKRDLNLESQTNNQYISPLTKGLVSIVDGVKSALNNFISYGTETTKSLGAGERAGVVNSFQSAFGKLPVSESEWSDVIKIGNGRWPSETSATAETSATKEFKKVYKRSPNMKQTNDNAAVTVMAYGLRPNARDFNSEAAAIRSFNYIFKRAPYSANDWDMVRAIAYSGAKR